MPDGTNITQIDPLLSIDEAARMLSAEFGRAYTPEQLRRAADSRRLPFFKDPITGLRVIRRTTLLGIFRAAETTPPAPVVPQPGRPGRPRKR